jgi:hypothetical protein
MLLTATKKETFDTITKQLKMEILGRSRMFTLLSLLLVITMTTLDAQSFKRQDYPFFLNNELIPNALTGGMNAPQFNAVDFNQDGKKDLVIFDRDGDVLMPFINMGGTGEISYQFAPEFIDNFPPVNSWMLLRDFNGDGLEDIFCFPSFLGVSGVEVHKAFVLNGEIGYEKVLFPTDDNDLINFNIPSGGRSQLYVSTIDIPDINDIDGDGDLDILTFNSLGGKIEYYQNQSVERGYGLDTLIYRLEEDCWGGLYESGNTDYLDLSDRKGRCAINFQSPTVGNRHTGSTVLTMDIDNDCDREIILGDLSFDHLVMGINGGDCDEAWINSQDTFFPSYDLSVDLPSFPSSFHIDVNNDGNRDLVAARNTRNGGADVETAWLYENIGSDSLPLFQFRQKDFMGETMLDFGTSSHPAVADVNGDGLLDIVVGIDGIYGDFGNSTDARLYLFLQEKNGSEISFVLEDDNWLNFKRYTQAGGNSPGQFGFAPAFGDLDNDGDQDIVVGTNSGFLIVGFNNSGPDQPMNFTNLLYQYKNLDIGSNASPAIFDVNEDGLSDIIVGELNFGLNYFQNTGSVGNPDFIADPSADPNSSFFGFIDLREQGIFSAYGTPSIMAFPDKTWLLVGKELGGLRLYDLQSNPKDTFEIIDGNFGRIREGERTHPVLADLDGDGVLDMIVGNSRGGIAIYKTPYDVEGEIVSTQNIQKTEIITFYPNPTSEQLYIKNAASLSGANLRVFDQLGRLVLERPFYDGNSIDVSLLRSGLYHTIMLKGKVKYTGSWVKE